MINNILLDVCALTICIVVTWTLFVLAASVIVSDEQSPSVRAISVTSWLGEACMPEYQPMSKQELRDMEQLYGRTFTEREAYELLRAIKLEDAYEDWARE